MGPRKLVMCAEKVILGIPADILSSEAELEACWKVGGTANLPNGFTLTPDQVSCKYCRAEQSLVIQVKPGLDLCSKDLTHLLLCALAFMCPRCAYRQLLMRCTGLY